MPRLRSGRVRRASSRKNDRHRHQPVQSTKIVIAGEIVEAEKVLLPAIEGCINARALKAFRKNLPVVRSTLDHRSAIGAFALVKRAMLNGTLLQRLLES